MEFIFAESHVRENKSFSQYYTSGFGEILPWRKFPAIRYHPPHTFTPTHLLPLPKKKKQNKLQKKHFAKKYKNKSCRDALPPKNTSPKTNETSDNAHRNACADYPHITSQCIYRVATIPGWKDVGMVAMW